MRPDDRKPSMRLLPSSDNTSQGFAAKKYDLDIHSYLRYCPIRTPVKASKGDITNQRAASGQINVRYSVVPTNKPFSFSRRLNRYSAPTSTLEKAWLLGRKWTRGTKFS